MKGLVEMSPGGMPDKKVAQALTSAGFTKRITKRSICQGVDYSGVKAIFASDASRGKIVFKLKKADHVGNPKFKNSNEQKLSYDVSVPRILSDEDWNILSLKRNQRRKWAKRNVQHEYLCKDILVCSVCSIPSSSRPKDTERFLKREKRLVRYPPTLYYTCARKQKTNGFRCSANKCHSVSFIDNLVWEKIVEVIKNPRFVTDKLNAATATADYAIKFARLSEAMLHLKQDLKKLSSTAESLAISLGKGLIFPESFAIAKEANQKEQSRIKLPIIEIEQDLKRETEARVSLKDDLQIFADVIEVAEFN